MTARSREVVDMESRELDNVTQVYKNHNSSDMGSGHHPIINAIYTAASEMLSGEESQNYCRKVDIMADAAYAILIDDPKKVTGNFFMDDEVLLSRGIKDLDQYACNPVYKDMLITDIFVSNAMPFQNTNTLKNKL